MRHDLRLGGFRFGLRPVTEADAALILELRRDPELGRWLHPISPHLADQLSWLESYFARPNDYYFVVEDLRTAAAVGVIGVYDIEGGRGEWGRWLIRKGSAAAVESALLIYRMALETLGLSEVYSRTVAGNAAVVSFHDSCGAARTGELKGYFQLGGTSHDAVEHRMDSARFAGVRPRLEALARRVADA